MSKGECLQHTACTCQCSLTYITSLALTPEHHTYTWEQSAGHGIQLPHTHVINSHKQNVNNQPVKLFILHVTLYCQTWQYSVKQSSTCSTQQQPFTKHIQTAYVSDSDKQHAVLLWFQQCLQYKCYRNTKNNPLQHGQLTSMYYYTHVMPMYEIRRWIK